MSQLVKEVITKLEDLKTKEFLFERTDVLGELVRTTLNRLDDFDSVQDDKVTETGTIELEYILSKLYFFSWDSKDSLDQSFNNILTQQIKILTEQYIN